MRAIEKWKKLNTELETLIDENGEEAWRYFNAVQFAMSSTVFDLLVQSGITTFEDIYETANLRMQKLIDDYKRKQEKQ